MNNEKLLDWAEFVATKFRDDRDGWKYSRNLGGLKHIRYESDYTGPNHWWKRFVRGLEFGWEHHFHAKPGSLAHQLAGTERHTSLWSRIRGFWIYFLIQVRKDSNLPDGQIHGIITHWEENGEYIALFQPRVGVKVIEFIRDNPNNQYARAILDEMHACKELSWPSKEKDDA